MSHELQNKILSPKIFVKVSKKTSDSSKEWINIFLGRRLSKVFKQKSLEEKEISDKYFASRIL